ncbi:hypothetical protein [Geopsychrobacter electrodiphilus]|uniref:hypothetical protein n=1 Tax=Geopsychrobacter electrodiphilus TaxID=225196 RepID=UPI00035EB234|nr:hypothetical protein [Geopsychrobacter electrodiphilus]
MAGFDQEKHLKPLIAVCLALLLLGSGWLYNSHQQHLAQLDRKIASARNELTELGKTLQEYRQLENQLHKMRPQKSNSTNTNLISTVENATEQVGARSLLIYVRPQPDKARDDLIEEGVEIKLEKMKLHQLVELLYQFDNTGQKLNVSQLRIRTRFDNPEQLDTSIILSQFKEKR